MSIEQEESSQQDYLQAAKATLGLTWDELAIAADIAPRALKNYRMPDDSRNHRSMPRLARRAIDQVLEACARKKSRKAAGLRA